MRLTRSRLRLVAALAIGGGAALALALPAGAAVSVASYSPPTVQALSLGDTATIDAKGAVVFAPVTVWCAQGATAYVYVTVTENVGGAIASGSTDVNVPCVGEPVSLTVSVSPTQAAFKKGLAFGKADLQSCFFTCGDTVDQHNIQIVKP